MRRLTFHLTSFDFPLIDNTRLSRDQFGDSSAELTLVYLPGSYASLKEKASYDEVVKNLRVLSEPGR